MRITNNVGGLSGVCCVSIDTEADMCEKQTTVQGVLVYGGDSAAAIATQHAPPRADTVGATYLSFQNESDVP